LKAILNSTDFNSIDSFRFFLDAIVKHVECDQRDGQNVQEKQDVRQQLKDDTNNQDRLLLFYDFIFSCKYLNPVYQLKLGDRTLRHLSPGEKGALLLIFYLIIDKNDIPLIIDQPEENLDNQSVYELLVPFVKEAKKRRQVIIVTHNPNLAVVCDAEQIICARIDKADNFRVIYKTGAIENSVINKRITEVLEGTLPAFDIRDHSYRITRSSGTQ
jgi:predicted ATPase